MSGGRGAFMLVVATLCGCQALPRAVPVEPVADPATAWTVRTAELTRVGAWSLRGRIAVSARGEGWSGNLVWNQDGDHLDLKLIGPLGSGTVEVSGHPSWMRIRASDGTQLETADPDTDLANWLGAPLPVASLRWWVLGLPDPLDPVAVELDSGARAKSFAQAGWRVTFSRYTRHDGRVVPGVVVAERAGSRLRVILDAWSVDGPDAGS